MKQVAIVCTRPRKVSFIEEPIREVAAGEVRVRTLFSGISTGTELTLFRGTNPYLHKHWDSARRLFVDGTGADTLVYPVTNLGYEEVGEVVEVGTNVAEVQPGTIVYGTWGHRTSAIIDAAFARDRQLPATVDPIIGIFSHIGPIALNGILDSAIRIGETVAVFGLGVVGQLSVQLAKLSGAEVIGVDMLPRRREIAQQFGADHVLDAGAGSVAEAIKELTAGRGADICIEASGAAVALHEAIRACAYSSKVVALGFYQGAALDLRLGEEFHHNRINLVCSQIAGNAPELQHRWNRLRLVQTFMRLAVQGKLALQPLITHVMPATEAPALFKLLDESPADALQAVLDFRADLSIDQLIEPGDLKDHERS